MSGSGTERLYIVEARTTFSKPETHGGMILDKEWRRVEFTQDRCGVQVLTFNPYARQCGLLNYEAAVALAMWFAAEPANGMLGLPAICVETRLVEIEFRYAYSTKEIGVGPAMNLLTQRRDTTFTERGTA